MERASQKEYTVDIMNGESKPERIYSRYDKKERRTHQWPTINIEQAAGYKCHHYVGDILIYGVYSAG